MQVVLGTAITTFAGFFRIYAEYASQHGNAAFLLEAWMRTKPRFRRFVQQVQAREALQPSLESLLILPVQRVPRYQLLLASLIEHTPPTHADRAPLEAALRRMKDTATFINDAVRAGQGFSKMMQLQEQFPTVALLAAERQLVYHARL